MANSYETRIFVRVRPGAPRNEITGFTEGVLRLRVAAPPVAGKANLELISFLSDVLGIPKSRISLAVGQTSRNKVLCVSGLSREEIAERLSSRRKGGKGK